MELGLTFGRSEPAKASPARPEAARVDDDLALLAAMARGDATALERLYERHARSVYSVALSVLADGPAAEDVVQETFVKLWRRPDAYQPSRGRLLGWLLGVAHHHAVDLLRRRNLEQRHRLSPHDPNGDSLVDVLDSRGLTSADDDPQTHAGASEQRLTIGRALASLPKEQRLPLELAYFKGLTQVEIAAFLEVPLGTIKTRMRLGLQRLRDAPELWRLWSER